MVVKIKETMILAYIFTRNKLSAVLHYTYSMCLGKSAYYKIVQLSTAIENDDNSMRTSYKSNIIKCFNGL